MTGGSALHGNVIQRSVRRHTYSLAIVDRDFSYSTATRASATRPGAEVVDELERGARVGDVVGDQHAGGAEVDEVGDGRQQHRQLEPLVDAGVELDADRGGVLDPERVRERAGDEQPAARDPEHEVGDPAVGVHRLGELAAADAEVVPAHHLSRFRRDAHRPIVSEPP